ncbi:MAG: MOSC N-terminal beta barrel domain-containing protein [Saprospiraceae bacterium]|nr:MOSC N-terminal beta barrel domain-containing protein [Candidatus Parvibacillus calidus]
MMTKCYEISHLYLYPIKGLPGILLEKAEVKQGGLAKDRLFAIFDGSGKMLTRRNIDGMADFEMGLYEDGVRVLSKRLKRKLASHLI